MGLLFSTLYHLLFERLVLLCYLIQRSMKLFSIFDMILFLNLKYCTCIAPSLSHTHMHDTIRQREGKRWSLSCKHDGDSATFNIFISKIENVCIYFYLYFY